MKKAIQPIAFIVFQSLCCMLFNKATAQPQKKLIHLGWESPSPKILKANCRMMEASSPFNGIAIVLRDSFQNAIITDGTIFIPKEINRKQLTRSIADLNDCHFQQFKYNFLRVNTVPGTLKWNDDKSWSIVARNMGTMAWFAKNTHLTGICYDPESYAAPQFQWDANSGLSFDQCQLLARKRGRLLMDAMAKEYPNITFWGLFMFSLSRSALDNRQPEEILSADKYGLYPAFINGLLDRLPPKAKLVEGNEDAYYVKSDEDLLRLYHDARMKALAFVAPGNINKFKTQYSVGLSAYIDMYSNPTGGIFAMPATANRTRLERFRDRLTTAMDITDEYVWVYDESHKWWDIPYSEPQYNALLNTLLWEDVLPGVTAAMEYAKHPAAYARQKLNAIKVQNNLVVNADFEDEVPKAAPEQDWSNEDGVPGYLSWKEKESNSSATIENLPGQPKNKVAVIRGDKTFCLIQSIPVIPGETYIVSADGKNNGGTMLMNVRWTDENKHLTDWYLAKNASFVKNNNEWSTATMVIKVPEGIQKMNLIINAIPGTQKAPFYFDRLVVIAANDLLKQ
jgi:hypothetical protein